MKNVSLFIQTIHGQWNDQSVLIGSDGNWGLPNACLCCKVSVGCLNMLCFSSAPTPDWTVAECAAFEAASRQWEPSLAAGKAQRAVML